MVGVVVDSNTHDVGEVAAELIGQLRYQCELHGKLQAQRFAMQ